MNSSGIDILYESYGRHVLKGYSHSFVIKLPEMDRISCSLSAPEGTTLFLCGLTVYTIKRPRTGESYEREYLVQNFMTTTKQTLSLVEKSDENKDHLTIYSKIPNNIVIITIK